MNQIETDHIPNYIQAPPLGRWTLNDIALKVATIESLPLANALSTEIPITTDIRHAPSDQLKFGQILPENPSPKDGSLINQDVKISSHPDPYTGENRDITGTAPYGNTIPIGFPPGIMPLYDQKNPDQPSLLIPNVSPIKLESVLGHTIPSSASEKNGVPDMGADFPVTLTQFIDYFEENHKERMLRHIRWKHPNISTDDALDIIQDAYVRLLTSFNRVEQERSDPFLPFIRWMTTIINNLIKDQQRKHKPDIGSFSYLEQDISSANTQQSGLERRIELRNFLEQLFTGASDLDLHVIFNRAFGYSYDEIVNLYPDLNSAGAARVRFSRATDKWRKELESP